MTDNEITALAKRTRSTFNADGLRGAMGDAENIGRFLASIEAEHGRDVLIAVLERWKELSTAERNPPTAA
jgi:hypothetical protein